MSHSREEVLSLLRGAEVAAVATVSGDRMRTRMMHFAIDDDFHIYLATMKGDPKTLQMTNNPGLSLLLHLPASDFSESQEIELTGVAHFVRDPEERQKALEITATKSPVVKYLTETGNSDALDCIKVEPQLIKLRVFREIVQGLPPSVIEFPGSGEVVNEWGLLGRKVTNWYRVLRPSSLTASLVPVLLGVAVAFSQLGGTLNWGYFLLTLLAGVLLQGGTNTINDYFDHKNGNDEANREFVRPFSGGSRLIQLGLLTPVEVLGLSLFCFLASTGIGLYLAWAVGPVLLVLGAVGLLSAFFYTGRPFYWARRGVGELLVGLNFGPLMALGAYYVQTHSFSWLPVVAATPVGLLIAAVLFINEFPDYAADKAVGKNTLVVRLGLRRAVVPFAIMMVAAKLAVIGGIALGYLPLAALLALVTLPASVMAIRYAASHYSRSFDMAPANALTITGHLAVGLALTWVFAFQGAGREGLVMMAVLGAVFLGFIAYLYWNVEHQKRIFHGLKGVVEEK
ncbi:MAG: 1,4-dihydroxy-2-naphthoate octaprenyltransferase [Dehalococcoidia bacterium]|nr:1,4-dihydroxy-2-naphthoate octaprenyltransferase [Dehalococcoidia bacterium]